MAATGTLPRIIQLPDNTYATPDGNGGWAPYTGALPGGGSAGKADDSFKVGDSEAINHAWDIVGNIDSAREISSKPLATGTMAASLTSLPVIGGLVGQNRANLQTKLGSVAGDLRQLGIRTLYHQTGQKGVGSVARNQAEQQALQNSLAAIGFVDTGGHAVTTGAQPDAATLNQGLGTARNIYLRHLARLYGMNPDDPNALSMIDTASKDPRTRANLLMQTQKQQPSKTSVAPPILKDEGTGNASVSGDTQVVEDPHLKVVGSHISQMLNSGASDNQIRAYARDNNVGSTNVDEELAFRRNNPGAAGKFTVSPEFYRKHVPLTGVRKAIASLDAVPYAGPAAVGAADTALMGAAPDIAGLVHGVTGVGPTRSDVIAGRDVSAAESPGSTFLGNMGGAILSPLGRGGGLGRTALMSGIYGAFGSDDPSISGRAINAGLSATLGTAAHGATSGLLNSTRPAYRAGRNVILSPIVDREALATDNALSRAANSMPRQDLRTATTQFTDLADKGANPPAAAVLSRAGQDYLGTLAAGSPAAKTAANEIAGANRQAMPQSLADDFNAAIRDATPANGLEKDMLSKPVREIAGDVQNMASREYEVGMRPIADEPLKVTPELTDVFTHERTNGAIRDALSNHQLDEATRAQLRGLPGQLKALGTIVPGGNAATQASIRAKYAAGIPLTVAGARNIATALDRTAAKLQEGSEGGVELRRLSGDIRSAIGEQYPEFAPINERYAGRMRAIDILDHTRSNFLGDSPEQIDALAKTAKGLSDVPNEAEYSGVGIPLYHGGAPFDPNYKNGPSFFTPDKEAAQTYAANHEARFGGQGVLQQAHVHIANPAPYYVVKQEAENLGMETRLAPASIFDPVLQGHDGKATVNQLMKRLKARGYDGTMLPDLPFGPRASGREGEMMTHIPFDNGAVRILPDGTPLPSNRQFAIAGAREAASTKAGSGTGAGGTRVAEELATGPNQQARNAMVLGDQGATKLAGRAGAKAQVSDVLQRIAAGPSGDQTEKWYKLAKRALMYKVTGGTAHYAAAYALSGIPGMSSADAARVVRVYMNSGGANQAFNSLSKAYGAQRARTIMARMAGVATGAAAQHQTPIGSPTGAQ